MHFLFFNLKKTNKQSSVAIWDTVMILQELLSTELKQCSCKLG
jgi:hypothetical protein